MSTRMSPLHKRLVALQSDGELRRKATKAKRRGGRPTVEGNDLIVRQAMRRRSGQRSVTADESSLFDWALRASSTAIHDGEIVR